MESHGIACNIGLNVNVALNIELKTALNVEPVKCLILSWSLAILYYNINGKQYEFNVY